MMLLLAVGPLLSLSPHPYDEHSDARAENADDFVLGSRHSKGQLRRFLRLYSKH